MPRPTRFPWGLCAGLLPLLASCHPPVVDQQASASSEVAGKQEPAVPAAPALTASAEAEVWPHSLTDLPADPRIEYGSLGNGMRWAWADHPEPQNRVYMRLHVNVGSLSETEEERGMAHFLEHMAFNGSKNFEAGTLVEWFQEQGMAFGADTNAHTSFSETVYKLDLPENDEETLREGMQVLRDFAAELTIAEEEVQAEKGVIDGEERERESAGMRAFVELLEKQYAGTLYPKRLPIGTKQARDQFDAALVRSFYQRWYRPENMTMVIVGDLAGYHPSELIAEYFATVPVPKMPVEREPDPGKPTLEQRFIAVQNRELPSMQMTLSMVRPDEKRADSQAERLHALRLGVAHAMVNLRFSELVKEPETPFLGASIGLAGQFDLLTGGSLDVVAAPERFGEALEEAYVEVRRALNFGFRQDELDEVRADWLRSMDEAVEREATQSSAGLRESILLEVEEGIVPTSASFDRDLFRPALESLTVDECLQLLREEWRGGTLTVNCVGPILIGDPEDSFTRIMERARERKIQPSIEVARKEWAYSSEGVSVPLPEQVGESGEGALVHQYRFRNGVMLNVKPTDFRDREVLVNVRVGRGMLALPQDRPELMMLGNALYAGGGLEEHDSDDIRRLTAGRQVQVGFTIGEDAFYLGGGTAPEDLTFQLELMRATLEHPGWRPDLLALIRSQIPLIFQQFEHSAQGPLLMDFTPALLQQDGRATILGFQHFATREALESFDMESLQELLSGPLAEAPIEVTIVGDLSVEEAIHSVARTFGAMPARESLMLPTVMPQASLAEGLRMTREVDTEDQKADLFLVFPTTDGIDDRTRRHLSFLGIIVDDRMRLRVREELGAAYSPSAGAESSETWLGLGGVLIQASGDPQQADALLEACLGVAAELASEGITQEEVDRLVAPVLKQLRDAQRSNGYWLDVLANAQSHPAALESARTVVESYQNLELDYLNELAARYLKPERGSALIVLPKSADEASDDE